MKLLILCASDHLNLKLAKRIESKATDFETSILNLVELDLPLFSAKAEERGIPEQVNSYREKVKEHDAIIVLSPEYNGGTPPVLTNFIAWVSRSSAHWREAFAAKLCAIGTVSGGGVNILNHLRIQMSYIGMNVISRQIHSTMKNEASDDDIIAVLDSLKSLKK